MTILLGNVLTLTTAALADQGHVGPRRSHVDADPQAAIESFVPANEQRFGAKFDADDDAVPANEGAKAETIWLVPPIRTEVRARMSAAEVEEFEKVAEALFTDRVRRGLVTDSRALRFSRGELALANARRDATLVDPATQRDLHADSDEPDGAALARALSTAWEG